MEIRKKQHSKLASIGKKMDDQQSEIPVRENRQNCHKSLTRKTYQL
jgi:hypothetical protein